jgi:hypothetical protein
MSVLPSEVYAELAQLLDALLMGLVEQIQGSNDATVGHPHPLQSCAIGN